MLPSVRPVGSSILLATLSLLSCVCFAILPVRLHRALAFTSWLCSEKKNGRKSKQHKLKMMLQSGWSGHVTRMGEGRGVYRFLVGKPEGRRPLGRSRYR